MTGKIENAYRYKPSIDGLRAIAILTVVAAHVDIPGFPGGFVGVDIFFVISGYLIINLILADIRSGQYSFFAFEARRVLRILPAFLFVMLVTLLLGTTIFVLPDYRRFAEIFFLATVLQGNHEFLSHQGYFEMAAFTQPLLHTWSLAVEEQFYLIAPLGLFGLVAWTRNMPAARAKRIWIGTSVGLGVIAFAACVIFTLPARNFSFYLMPTRGWEFVLGGAAPVAAAALRRCPRWAVELLAFAGVAAIAYAVHGIDAAKAYPSYWVAWPALGATLIIATALADSRICVARLLAIRPLVLIGLVSYPWYLWHWPLLSFFRTTNFGQRDLVLEVLVAAVAFLLAVLTYRLIEVPIRNYRPRLASQPIAVVLGGLAACVFIALTGFGWAAYVAPKFLPAVAGLEPVALANARTLTVAHRGVLLGDSHADRILLPLDGLARSVGAVIRKVGSGGCPPVLGVAVVDHSGERQETCDENYRNLNLTGHDFAILHARWNNYLGLPPSDPYYPSFGLSDPRTGDRSNPDALLDAGLTAMIGEVKNAGVGRILIVGPLPEFPAPSIYCLMRSLRVGIDLCTISRKSVEERRTKTMNLLRDVASRFAGARLIDPIDVFCGAAICRPFAGRTLYFTDTNHLSPAGVERLYRAFQRDFLWVLTGDEPKAPAAH